MSSANTLMLYQQDLALGPYYVKLQLVIDADFPLTILKNDYIGGGLDFREFTV